MIAHGFPASSLNNKRQCAKTLSGLHHEAQKLAINEAKKRKDWSVSPVSSFCTCLLIGSVFPAARGGAVLKYYVFGDSRKYAVSVSPPRSTLTLSYRAVDYTAQRRVAHI